MSANYFFHSLPLLDINLSNPFIKVLLPLAGIVIVFLLCKYKYHFSLTDDLQLRKPPMDQLFVWVAIALAWMLTTDYFMNWRGAFDFNPWLNQPLYVSVLRVLAVCFLGPILEELIFRGLFYHRIHIKLRVNEWLTVLILAAIWAVIHYTYPLPVIGVIFVEGLLLGAAVIKSKSLIVPIVMHICWNLYAIW